MKELQPITEQAYRYYDAHTEREQPRFYREDLKRDESLIQEIRMHFINMPAITNVIHAGEKPKLKEPKKFTLGDLIVLLFEMLIEAGKAFVNLRSTKNPQYTA